MLGRIRELVTEREVNRRFLVVLLLLVAALFAAGIGTEDEGSPEPELQLGTPTPDGDVPTTGTPTPAGSPVDTPGDTPATRTAGPGDGTPTGTTGPGSGPSNGSPASTPLPNGGLTDTDGHVGAPDSDRGDEDGIGGDGNDRDGTSGDGSDGDGTDGVALQIRNDTVRIQASNILPGDAGNESFVVANVGNDSGRLRAGITVKDGENSVLEPERVAGDDASSGELSSALRVRVFVNQSGRPTYLVGSSTEYVTLDTLDDAFESNVLTLESGEEATVRFEWKLPRSTGNRVQTDVAVFSATFSLS